MGIQGNFKQISLPLLNLVIKDLYALDLYLNAKKTIEIGALQTLNTYLKGNQICVESNVINEDQWRVERLDIDSYWHAVHYLLTEDVSSWEECQLPFVVSKKSENTRLLINAVMGQTAIDGTEGGFKDFGPVRYLTPKETQLVSEALLQISLRDFRERYEDALTLQPKVHVASSWDVDEETYWDIIQEISAYYKIAVEKERGMLLYLGCFYGSDFVWESNTSC